MSRRGARLAGVQAASGSLATSIGRGRWRQPENFSPARGADTSTLAEVVDLGVNSGSLMDLREGLLPSAQQRARSAGTSAIRSTSGSAMARRPSCVLPPHTHAPWDSATSSYRALSSNDMSLNRSTRPSSWQAAPPADPASLESSAGGSDREVLTRGQYQQQRVAAAAAKQSLAVYVLLCRHRHLLCDGCSSTPWRWRPRNGRASSRCSASRRQQAASENDDPRRDPDHGYVRTGVGSLYRVAPGSRAFSYSMTGSAFPSVSAQDVCGAPRRLRRHRVRRERPPDGARPAHGSRQGDGCARVKSSRGQTPRIPGQTPDARRPLAWAISPRWRALGLTVRSWVARSTATSPNVGR